MGKLTIWSIVMFMTVLCSFASCTNQTTGSEVDLSVYQQELPASSLPAEIPVRTVSANVPEDVPALFPAGLASDMEADGATGDLIKADNARNEDSVVPERVDVVYFHRAKRCVTCLCFEERITHALEKNFMDEVKSGKITYEVVNLGDKTNKDLAVKYGAISSQLFINTVIDGADHIEDVMDIWDWNCRTDGEGFEANVRDVIDARLRAEY
ncbi:MAG: hypothetical protein JW954_01940 [Dehalococcoidaceae bacterium]|nr:hypothetical protein [Dehalococcoidaceae bacterium]